MAFNVPNFNQIGKRTPVYPLPAYAPAGDWPSMTPVDNEVLFLVSNGTNAKYAITTTFTRPGSENIYIDWGDGTTDTISSTSSTTTLHTFTTGGTPSTRGYDTWKIRVYGDSGTRITLCKSVQYTGDYANNISGLLQAVYGDNTILGCSSSFTAIHGYLEYIRLPEGMTSTSMSSVSFNTQCLQAVDMPTSYAAAENLSTAFYNCSSLVSITFPSDMTAVTTAAEAFSGCYSLESVVYPATWNSCTAFNRTHQNNYSLGTAVLPELPNCTTFDFAFNACRNLKFINIPKIKSGASVNFTAAFGSCSSLVGVNLDPTTTATIDFNTTFSGCSSIKSITIPPNVTATGYANAFNTCSSLVNISLPTSGTSIASGGFVNTFQSCAALTEINLPSAPSASQSFASTFQGCNTLSKVVIPSGYNITSLGSTFQNCQSLNTVEFSGTLNNCTTMSSTFQNCFSLTDLTLPTGLTSVTTISNAFTSNYALTSVTFPATMSALTTMSNAFQNCYSLTSVTLPTTVGTQTGSSFGAMFQNCYSLREITFPASVGTSITSFNAAFQNCYALKTLTLPTTQTTGLQASNMANAFNGCYMLTTINNLDKLGNDSTGSTIYLDGTSTFLLAYSLTSATFRAKFSKLVMGGTDGTANKSKLTSLRLLNTGSGQYAGSSPQVDVKYSALDATALDQIFTDLPTVTGKTINITGCDGAATCTRSIATGKGWTVTG
jgi:uncharacterized protein YceK